MKQKLTALAFAAACTAVLSATPVYATTFGTFIGSNSVDNGLIVIDEYDAQYVVHNNSSLWIWGFAVTNPSPGGSTSYKNWQFLTVPLGNNNNTINANGYLAFGASLDSNSNPILPPLPLDFTSFIAPTETAYGFFHFTSASDIGVLTFDSNGAPQEFQSTTPLPAALPLFASGLGVIGLLARRRKRKNAALALA